MKLFKTVERVSDLSFFGGHLFVLAEDRSLWYSICGTWMAS